jgi:hypothetical protein
MTGKKYRDYTGQAIISYVIAMALVYFSIEKSTVLAIVRIVGSIFFVGALVLGWEQASGDRVVVPSIIIVVSFFLALFGLAKFVDNLGWGH